MTLAPGESKTVTFSLGPDERRYWSAATRGWVNEASTFDVWAGSDSNATLTTSFEDVLGAPKGRTAVGRGLSPGIAVGNYSH